MAEPSVTGTNELTLTLAHEELWLILRLLKAEYVFGLEPEPFDALTPDQAALRLLQAERSMRARDLARLNEVGKLELHPAVLTCAAVCVSPVVSVLAHHFPAAGASTQFFGHRREGKYVLHILPAPGLHSFSIFSNAAYLATALIEAASIQDLAPTTGVANTVSGNAIAQAREQAAAGSPAAAVDLLRGNGVDPDMATKVVTVLSGPHNVSIFHLVARHTKNTIAKQELTVLHNSTNAWEMSPYASIQPGAAYRIAPANSARLHKILVGFLELAESNDGVSDVAPSAGAV